METLINKVFISLFSIIAVMAVFAICTGHYHHIATIVISVVMIAAFLAENRKIKKNQK